MFLTTKSNSEITENGWNVGTIFYKSNLCIFDCLMFLAFYKLLSSCSVWSRTWCISRFSSFAVDKFSAIKSNSQYKKQWLRQ